MRRNQSGSQENSSDSGSRDEDDDEDMFDDNAIEDDLDELQDDLDPEARAALDKEVEEFRQRLESVNTQSVRIKLFL